MDARLADIRNTVKGMLPEGVREAVKYARLRNRMRKQMAMRPEEYPEAIKQHYEQIKGKPLDLDNPQTFSEKIQWMKAYHSTPEYGRLADKYLVRSFVADRIGEKFLTKLYGVWDDADDIDFDALPDRFALKATHGCGWNIIVRDKSELDEREARRKLRRWLKLNYAFIHDFELHYQYCEPRIIAEEYLANDMGEDSDGELSDIKFFCFDGKVHYIAYYEGRYAHETRSSFFDPDWNEQDFQLLYSPIKHDVARPENLDEMIRLAECLAEGFPHVRVDFYRLDDGRVVFGELTFTTGSGVGKWETPQADVALGEPFVLPLR